MSSSYEQFNEDFSGFLKEMLKSGQSNKSTFCHPGRQMGKSNYLMQTLNWKSQNAARNLRRKPKMWRPKTSLEACKRLQTSLRMHAILGNEFAGATAEYVPSKGEAYLLTPEKYQENPIVSSEDLLAVFNEVSANYAAVYPIKPDSNFILFFRFYPDSGNIHVYANQAGYVKERCYIPKLE